ncbi:MAG: hypothetical protein HZB13_15185 [Acidobacteria bacterium]|nr:hypothetical protein [Acidobacteriota bacterium]
MRATIILLFALFALTAAGQRPKFQVNTETPEGQLLQKAGQESDDAKRIALYEEFLAKFPKHEGATYAWNQAQPFMLKAKMLDKTIEAGAAVLAADPLNAPAGYNALQACEQKADANCIVTWSINTAEAARKMIASKKPDDEEEVETWTREVDFAKQVITRCEYSLYAAALQSADAKNITALFEALEKLNPESQYMTAAGGRYLIGLLQLKDLPKAQAFADRAADRNQANEDVLLFAADANLSGGKSNEKAAAYAEKLTSTLPAQAAPQGMAAADWETKKSTTLARAYWIAGAAYCALKNWAQCEKSMRAGLPIIESNPASKELKPGAYFYLGLANHSLARSGPKVDPARIVEARKYFTLCAALPSPFLATAQKNLVAIAAGK